MTTNEINNIQEKIDDINKADLNKFIVENNPNVEPKDIYFGDYNSIEFLSFLKETLDKLQILINSDIRYLLSNNFHANGGAYNLESVLGNIYNHIIGNNRDAAKNMLEIIVCYCSIYGGWENIKTPVSVSKKTINELKAELDLLKSKIDKDVEDFNQKKSELDDALKSSKEIEDFSKKISETNATITGYASASQTNSNNIAEANTRITGLETTLTNNIKEYQKDFAEIKEQNEDSLKNAEKAEKIMEEILAKETEINRLLGQANDGSLGAKFHERQEKIQKYSSILILLVIVAFFATCCWTFHVFQTYTAQDWMSFVMNMIRTSPAWFLVWWLIGRYTNERKLQEEYAFKAAVAMSMRNHSDLLKDDDDGKHQEERATRQIMLQRALENIYKNPNSKEKGLTISSKSINDSLKQLIEIVKK
nr:MAG TPA: chromosome segregation ATPase [Caudoviricetes sp.]